VCGGIEIVQRGFPEESVTTTGVGKSGSESSPTNSYEVPESVDQLPIDGRCLFARSNAAA
jgi:hypothetical protein